jgi:hypothetical protein
MLVIMSMNSIAGPIIAKKTNKWGGSQGNRKVVGSGPVACGSRSVCGRKFAIELKIVSLKIL